MANKSSVSFLSLSNYDDPAFPGNRELMPLWQEYRYHKVSDIIRDSNHLKIDLVILDISFNDKEDQLEEEHLLIKLKEVLRNENLPFVIITGSPLNRGYELVKHGTIAFIDKNEADLSLWQKEIARTYQLYDQNLMRHEKFITSINSYNQLFTDIGLLIENAQLPIFLWGKVGVGKYFIARNLLGDKLTAIEAGALLTDSEWEQQLTQIDKDNILFINNIQRLTSSIQQKLIQLAQDGQKVILCSRKNPEKLGAENSLDENFIHYFGNHPIRIWTLRERHRDLPLLINHFLQNPKICLVQSTFFKSSTSDLFHTDAIKKLYTYEWPANILGLKTLINQLVYRRFYVENNQAISLEELPPKFRLSLDMDQKEKQKQIADYDFLKVCDEWLIKNENSIDHTAISMETPIETLKAKVKEIYLNRPEVFLTYDYQNVYNVFKPGPKYRKKVNVFIWYHENSKEYGDHIKNSAIPLTDLEPLIFEDRQIILGKKILESITDKIIKADILICLFCKDSVKMSEEMRLIMNRLETIHDQNILIRAKPFYSPALKGWQLLPSSIANKSLKSIDKNDELDEWISVFFEKVLVPHIRLHFTQK